MRSNATTVGVSDEASQALKETIDAIYRSEGPRVLATLIRLLGALMGEEHGFGIEVRQIQ